MEYLAGFIDGEGCVQMGTNGAYMEISHTYLEVLDDIHREFGGVLHGPYYRKLNWKPAWRWRIRGEEGKGLAVQLLPYLREKRRQVEYMIEWMDALPNGEKRKLLTRLCTLAKKTTHDTHTSD